MTAPQHAAATPGPWRFELVQSSGELVYCRIFGHPLTADTQDALGFAGTYLKRNGLPVSRMARSEALANARLIAAAPDLLAALEDGYMLALQIPHGSLRLANQATLCRMRDGIAEATGRTGEDVQTEAEAVAFARSKVPA